MNTVINDKPLTRAIELGNVEIIEYLLQKGNYKNLDELYSKVNSSKHQSMISNEIKKLLIKYGAHGNDELS